LEIELRRGTAEDLARIAEIQAGAPEASQWDVREYLQYDLTVAVCDGTVAGFALARRVAEDESEVLNLAVDPLFRRRGIGRRLILEIIRGCPGSLWLEVRESNLTARKLYKSLNFRETGRRAAYYSHYNEGAIVMNRLS